MGVRFLSPEERDTIARELSPAAVAERLRALRAEPATEPAAEGSAPAGPALTQEVYEVERRDEDRGGA